MAAGATRLERKTRTITSKHRSGTESEISYNIEPGGSELSSTTKDDF